MTEAGTGQEEGVAPKMHQAGEGDRAREDAGPASKAPAREGSGGPILATAGQEMGRRTEEAGTRAVGVRASKTWTLFT